MPARALPFLVLLLAACGGGASAPGGGSVLGEELTSDPDALLSAEVAGEVAAPLEVALTVLGLLTEIPQGPLPAEAVVATEAALGDLLSGCLTFTAITGPATGLDVQFAAGGCGIPAVGPEVEGGFAFSTTSAGPTSSWHVELRDVRYDDIHVDGAVDVTRAAEQSLTYDVADLDVTTPDRHYFVDSAGSLTTSAAHDGLTFTGAGRVTRDDLTVDFDIQNLNREFGSDCYPQSGSISVTVTRQGLPPLTAEVLFEDDGLGLDSDDSGLVRVQLGGVEHTAKVPARSCE